MGRPAAERLSTTEPENAKPVAGFQALGKAELSLVKIVEELPRVGDGFSDSFLYHPCHMGALIHLCAGRPNNNPDP